MQQLWAKIALTESGWSEHVSVEIDQEGRIAQVAAGQPPSGNQFDILLPAPVNCHSHAFQRAMAGLTESRGPDTGDSFWTWRDLMYRFLDQLTPDHVEAVAALVHMEMLEAGFASSVEFHYLHHQVGGAPYNNIAELSERICAAASRSGIGLTLLPVHYQFGGCDQRPLIGGQLRFGNNLDQFAKLAEGAQQSVSALPKDSQFGVAPHSLRAVSRNHLDEYRSLSRGGPVHLHLAEQVAEVEEVKAHYGARPVEWLLDNVPVDQSWCLIHCTQMMEHETVQLAKTGAIAGLCPITESSLGDGIFDGVSWLNTGGQISVGSDSNIQISLAGELRTLEYSQRLRDRSRAALATAQKSTGSRLFEAVCAGGAKAANRECGVLAAGNWADVMALDASHHDLAGKSGDPLIDSFVFAGAEQAITDVWSAGRHLVTEGKHVRRDQIVRDYVNRIGDLKDRL